MTELIKMKLKDIHPYEKNPRKNDEAVEKVANSIRDFGYKQPIVVDKDGIIIAGHTRYKAAKKLKLDTVPVIYASDLTPEQVQAYRIADNSAGSNSTWDYDLLQEIMAEIGTSYDMSTYGLDIGGAYIETPAVLEDIEENKPTASRDHPTMKPTALLARMIYNSSRPGDIILDPFGGSGSTMMACEQLHRRCAMMELDPVYCDVIVKRWEALTGKKAEVVS